MIVAIVSLGSRSHVTFTLMLVTVLVIGPYNKISNPCSSVSLTGICNGGDKSATLLRSNELNYIGSFRINDHMSLVLECKFDLNIIEVVELAERSRVVDPKFASIIAKFKFRSSCVGVLIWLSIRSFTGTSGISSCKTFFYCIFYVNDLVLPEKCL